MQARDVIFLVPKKFTFFSCSGGEGQCPDGCSAVGRGALPIPASDEQGAAGTPSAHGVSEAPGHSC
jgi:hypothetical protein